MTDIVNRIKEQVAEFEAQRKLLLVELQQNFSGMFTEVFNEFPEINSFTWNQFTPYFNDGESCEFTRHDIYALRVMDDEDYEPSRWAEEDDAVIEGGDKLAAWKHYLETGSFPNSFYSHLTEEVTQRQGKTRTQYLLDNSWIFPAHVRELTLENMGRETEIAVAAGTLIHALNEIPEDFYLSLFGDHVKVTVTRDGVETEEFDHD